MFDYDYTKGSAVCFYRKVVSNGKKHMKKLIIVIVVLLATTACAIRINYRTGTVEFSLEGSRTALNTPVSTNTPRPTITPQIQTVITVMGGTNIRANSTTNSPVVFSVRSELRTVSLGQSTVGSFVWHRISIQISSTTSIEGWVRADRLSNTISVTTTPAPAIDPTPTQQLILRITVPLDGLDGYACRLDVCIRPNLQLDFFDEYRVYWMNEDWAWVCVLALDRETCNNQFYVKVR